MSIRSVLSLLVMAGLSFSLPAGALAAGPEKQAFFGDLHIHTSYSMDAFMRNVRTTPDDAYRYAKGEAIPHPNGATIRLDGPPLDFLAVSDHAEFLGIHASFLDPESANFKHPIKDYLLKPFADEREFQTKMRRLSIMARKDPSITDPAIIRDAWQRTIEVANKHNNPGVFTAFIGYEFTATERGQHKHRNVIFRGSRAPSQPFTAVHSRDPQDLWDWLDAQRADGIEGLAIPHNMNQSNGLAFPTGTFRGEPMSRAFAEQWMRNEPIVEVTQQKGTSETHPLLSPNDEWADFQIVQYYLNKVDNTDPVSVYKGSYTRDALLVGLSLQASEGYNPHKFGFIGSSDSHTAGASYEEANHFSSNTNDPTFRGSAPPDGSNNWEGVFTTRRASHGPGGLAGVWAEENTRASIYDAMRRKETFATSGPRIRIRLHAKQSGSDTNVPMGGTLSASDETPAFHFWAARDIRSAWLERVQIVKGWIDDGAVHERVFDVACANGETADKTTHRCPDYGSTINLQDCSIDKSHGATSMQGTWLDPTFEAEQYAFYYLRVLEVPTCRWSTWDAVRLGIPPNPTLQLTQQDRAWSSPIWYDPNS